MCPKSPPLRTCAGCGEKKQKERMVRIVADPAGRLIPDLRGTLPSRGTYVCPEARCVTRASGGRLGASLRLGNGPGQEAGNLSEIIAAAYRRRVLSLLGQARKSGRVTSGTNLVEGALRRGSDGTWLALLAVDASPLVVKRMRKALKAASVPHRTFLHKTELGDALGKSPRSVLLVRNAGMAKGILESLDRCQSVLSHGGLNQ